MASNAPIAKGPKRDANYNSLQFMTRLSGLVYFFRPQQFAPDPAAPKLILLATWMDARKTHIVKYVTQYQALYPTSCILLIRSSFKCHLNPRIALKSIEPAVEIIRQELSSVADDDRKPQMLVHMFSNGGSCMIYHLYRTYAKHTMRTKTEKSVGDNESYIIPRHLSIYDSAPGGWDYQPATSAVLHSLPVGVTRQLAYPFVHLVGAYWWMKYRGLRVAEETVVWGLAHNSDANKLEIARVYFYSEVDKMVDFRDVEAHIEDAITKGFVVARSIKLPDSDHVAHARQYPEVYWSTIREAWESKL